MSYPKNFKKNCSIYDKVLYTDIKKYQLAEDSTSLKIIYDNTNISQSIAQTRLGLLKAIIDSNVPDSSVGNTADIWLPAIISNDNYILTKEALLGNVIGNKVFGIEEIFKFTDVKLENWDIERGSMDLCLDWTINSNVSAYDVEYGVLFWYKNNSINKSTALYDITQVPVGTRLRPSIALTYARAGVSQTIATTDVIIKIDDKTIKRLDKDSSKFVSDTSIIGNGSFVFNTNEELEIIPLSILNSTTGLKFYVEDNTNSIDPLLVDYDLWISNGEFFSYFLGGKDKYDRFSFSTVKSPSRSYISPSIYHIYRNIYNSLTINRIKRFDSLGSTASVEKLQKLSYILATSPLIDKVNINYLQDNILQQIIYNEYIDLPADADITTEINKLTTIVAKIFKYYKQQSYFLQKNTLGTNYVTNKTQLFTQLLNKYGAYFKIGLETKLKYNKPIDTDGPHGLLNFNAKTCINKTTNPDTDIYNDMRIDFGNMYVESQMNPDISPMGCICKIGDSNNNTAITEIPLANMAMEKIPDKIYTVFNKDISIKLLNTGDLYEGDQMHNGQRMPVNINITDTYVDSSMSEGVSYFWSLVDGPDCLRFSDFPSNGRADILNRNRTSTDNSPSIFVKQTGLYTIQGIASYGSTLKSIENIRVYVHNDGNQYEPGKTLPTLMSYNQNQTPNRYRVMVPNFRQIAFNKNGLVWFVDNDMYISDNSYPSFVVNRRLVDKKILIANYGNPTTLQNSVSVTFKPNTTIMKLLSIKIEHMRDHRADNSLSQCNSFYEPKLARIRDSFAGGAITGAARFWRINRDGDSVDLLSFKKVNNTWQRDISRTFSFELPRVSMTYGPTVHSYGGYSKNVVDKIGIDIPYHPIKVGNDVRSYPKIPNSTAWGVDVSKPPAFIAHELASGFLASNPASLTNMDTHNDFGGINPFFRCHLANIPITGYTVFDKGYFHPNSGWYYYSPTGYNPAGFETYRLSSAINSPNITSIQKFDAINYKSYNFTGPGFYDLRSINNTDRTIAMEHRSAIQVLSYQDAGSPSWQDQDPNYGLRNYNGLDYRSQEMIDDFIVIRDVERRIDFDCSFTPTNQYVFVQNGLADLKIKDLEVNINLMNICNPKNIVIALEVYNPNLDNIISQNSDIYDNKIFIPFDSTTVRSTSPLSWTTNIKSQLPLSDIPTLNFLQELKNTNTTNKLNTRVLYLYNQENLDNYNYNFSLTFSDNISSKNTFTDENKLSVSGVSYYNDIILNDNVIQPCLSPTGYSEKQSILHRHIIKNSRINLTDSSLSKFKMLPLQGTTFTLKIYMLGGQEKIQVLDNTLLNSQLSGLSSYEQRESSNTILNSICDWSVIVHTERASKFTTKDYLGSIDYASQPVSRSGYNYIADFTGKEYLLPKINLNAPYPYIITNSCRYPNNEDLSKPLTYRQILFPYVGWYIPTFFTLVGALTEISIIQATLAIGGRGDPIINMLYDIRFQREQQDQERFYFKPVYNGAYPGSPDKALIQASKDGFNWYRMEVPIFKYSNTAILQSNKYKYFKLHKDIITPLSNFAFTKIQDNAQIVDTNRIVLTTTKNINLSGLVIQVSDTESKQVNEFDLINVTAQQAPAQNGIYYARASAWIRYPDPAVTRHLQYDRLWGNDTITPTNIKNNQIISVPGSRLFNLYDINDTIAVMKTPAATGLGVDLFSNTILNKALIYYNNQHHTIITLSQPLPPGTETGFIGKTQDNSNHLIIYKDNTSKNNNLNVGKWGLTKSAKQKQHINKNIVNGPSIATAEGSIGYGSLDLNPLTYSVVDESYPNRILDTDEIINNHVNNKLKYNSILVKESGTTDYKRITFTETELTNKNLLQGYPYRDKELEYLLDSLSNYNLIFASGLSLSGNNFTFSSGVALTGTVLEQTKMSIKNSLSSNDEEYYFIDLKSDKFKTETTAISGELIIENDYNVYAPFLKLTPAQTGIIYNRLNSMKIKSDPPLVASQINFDTISSIPDLEQFYNDLPGDPSGCFKQNYYPVDEFNIKCSGYRSKQKLSELYAERNELTYLLEEDAKTPTGVLPYCDVNLRVNSLSQAVNVGYIPKQYYFISIDPNQTCTLSQDTTIKILTKVSYTCSPVVEFYQFPECDSVCKSITTGAGIDENLVPGDGVVYVNNRVQEEKNRYPGIQWNDNPVIVNREFFINCGSKIRDTLVKVKEEYIYPRLTTPPRGLVKDIFNLDSSNQVFLRFRNIPRKLKTIDNLYYRYIYDYYGRLGVDIIPPKGGGMDNNFMAWQCVKVNSGKPGDPYPTKQDGAIIESPPLFKWMNEMIFRAFFGSSDGVENKNEVMDSKEMWEWIPYEYF